MEKASLLFSFCFVCFICVVETTSAQVYSTKDRGENGSYILTKSIPDRLPPEIRGSGVPVGLYVVQIARFEEMSWDKVPSRLPKGTFLWINPDHSDEALLLAGFYNTFKDAENAAKEWKKRGKAFEKSFAREKPFFVEYR